MRTFLTEAWQLRVPIISAPMSPQAGGRLAAAVSRAGGLGMIGVAASQTAAQLLADADECHAAGVRFGIGLMTWAIEKRPELLDAAIEARPFALTLSFGDAAPYAERIRDAGIQLVCQVQDLKSALVAERAGASLLVAQGTEAGGHTGEVGTLPLLQIVLDAVQLPVVAAGGIGTGRGLAAVLAAGAAGAWIGTRFLVAEEARNSAKAREQLAAADETDTVLTSTFDAAQRIPWPAQFRGRALKNDFTARWHGREPELLDDAEARRQFDAARQAEDYRVAHLYAGQAVALAKEVEPAAAIVERLVQQAAQLLSDARLR
ncbi:MAG: nitronate monooxygenase [Myxococcales bacterium]